MTDTIVKDLPLIQFGTDGWRGITGSEINEASVSIVAAAFAAYLKKSTTEATCIIGYDGREYSEDFARAFASVLIHEGINTKLSDRITPTPYVSFYTKKHKLTAGVMITASHNPAQYNGIKFKGSYGGPFMTEETQKVEALLSNRYDQACMLDLTDITKDYIVHVTNLIDMNAIKESGIKPLIDSMAGAGETHIGNILQLYDIQSDTIYGEATDDFSGRYAEPIEKNLKPLSEALKNSGEYCCGFATDGDADRLGVMMENGEWLSAQETILYLNDYLINVRNEKGGIVKTSSVTDKISLLASKVHPLYEVQVGFKYICELMLKTPVAIGCEESGGFGFSMHIPERDGIFSALIFLEMLARSGYKRLSDFIKAKRKQFGNIFYDRIDHVTDRPDRINILPMLYEKKMTTFSGFDILDTDTFYSSRGIVNGMKFRLKGSCRWLLLRASETEPLMRIYAEGQSDEEVDLFLKNGIKLISE